MACDTILSKALRPSLTHLVTLFFQLLPRIPPYFTPHVSLLTFLVVFVLFSLHPSFACSSYFPHRDSALPPVSLAWGTCSLEKGICCQLSSSVHQKGGSETDELDIPSHFQHGSLSQMGYRCKFVPKQRGICLPSVSCFFFFL